MCMSGGGWMGGLCLTVWVGGGVCVKGGSVCVCLGVDDYMHRWLCVYARWATVCMGNYMDVYGSVGDCVGGGWIVCVRVAVCVLGGGDCQCVGMGDFRGG